MSVNVSNVLKRISLFQMNLVTMRTLKFSMLSIVVFCIATSGANRPKGVRVELASFYNPATDFKCLDGSSVIPFIQVNDDYCDCEVSKKLISKLICSRLFSVAIFDLLCPMATGFQLSTNIFLT